MGSGNWLYFSHKERWVIITLIGIVTLLGIGRWAVSRTQLPTQISSQETIDVAIGHFEKQLKPITPKPTKKKEKKAPKTPVITPSVIQRMGNVNDVEKELYPQ